MLSSRKISNWVSIVLKMDVMFLSMKPESVAHVVKYSNGILFNFPSPFFALWPWGIR
jgi:hypothetical protein